MEDSDIQSKQCHITDVKADYFTALPNEVLMKIFCYLEIYDVMNLNLVCKRWNNVSGSDILWGKFVPKYPGVDFPKAKTQQCIFRKLWSECVQIGEERWFLNPLPGLVEYNTLLQKHNVENIPDEVDEIFFLSKCMLYLRLNPLYPFTTDGVQQDDPLIREIVYKISDKRGNISRPGYESDEDVDVPVPDTTSLIETPFFGDKKFAMWIVVDFCFDSKTSEHPNFMWQNEDLIDEEGHITQDTGNAFMVPGRMCLNKSLFNQIRNIVVGENDRFIIYNVDSRHRNKEYEELAYGRQILVSDTAVVYCAGRRFKT